MEEQKVYTSRFHHDNQDVFLYKDYFAKTGKKIYFVRYYFNAYPNPANADYINLVIKADNLHDCKIKWAIAQMSPYNSNVVGLGDLTWNELIDYSDNDTEDSWIECVEIDALDLLETKCQECHRESGDGEFKNPLGSKIEGVYDLYNITEDLYNELMKKEKLL